MVEIAGKMVNSVVYVILVVSIVCNFVQILWPGLTLENGVANNVRRALNQAEFHKQELIGGMVVPPGARKIFIDLGANDGSSTSYFLDPVDGINSGNIAIQGGDKDSFLRGLGASKDWEVVVFEANTNFTRQLHAQQAKYMNSHSVKNFTVYGGTAISKASGSITFIIDNPFSGSAGATTMPESTSAVGPHYTIPAVGIVDLFHNLKIHHSDFVIVKMDIEGYEFELVRHILTHGVHTRIDVLAVEYHDENYWVFGKTDEIRIKYQAYHKCLDWMMEDIHAMKLVKWGR